MRSHDASKQGKDRLRKVDCWKLSRCAGSFVRACSRSSGKVGALQEFVAWSKGFLIVADEGTLSDLE